ncbi:MAG: hypothetical protein HY316_01920, partial [Acidobacteria bacterium]|nr:hypothetical protein [Acidobacteriota bacterium]
MVWQPNLLRFWREAQSCATFRFPAFLGALLVLGVAIRAMQNPMDPDSWWHVAVGERILQDGSFPETDTFSFTAAGTSWIAYEWLGEVLMASAAKMWGFRGHSFVLLLTSSLLFLLLYYYAYLRSRNWKAAFAACTVVLPLAGIFFTLRPQLLGYSLLVLTLICLERFRQGNERAIWALPFIFLVWVNTHGSFAFGLFVVGLYWTCGLVRFQWGGLSGEKWTDRQRLCLEISMLLSVAGLCVTPYGTRLAAYPFELALLQPANVANIVEWQPLTTNLSFGKFFVGLLLLYFLAQTVARQTYQLHELALLFFSVFSASLHRRFLIIFVIMFAPLLAALLARWFAPYDPAKDRPLLNGALVVAMLAALFWIFPSEGALQEQAANSYPQRAVQYLQDHPIEGSLWNEYGWGGYLIWARHPKHRVFIDGRADIYEYSGILSDYLRIDRLHPDALSLLRKYDIRASLVRRNSPLGTLLRTAPGWSPVYADKVSELLVFQVPAPALEIPSLAASPSKEFPASAALLPQSELRQAHFETVPN